MGFGGIGEGLEMVTAMERLLRTEAIKTVSPVKNKAGKAVVKHTGKG